MENILSSFGEWWREKKNSSLYFTYLFFLILWNWKFLFLLFVEDNIPPFVSNFQYALSLYEPITNHYWVDFLIYKGCALLPPVLFTFLAVKYLPRLNAWAHEIEVGNYFKRRLVYDEQRTEFERQRTTFLKDIAEQKEKQKAYKEDIEEQTTEKEQWQNEFAELASDKVFVKAMSNAIDAIYYHAGSFNQGAFGKEFLDLLLARQIVEVNFRKQIGEARLEFTAKGEEFAKMFTAKSRYG